MPKISWSFIVPRLPAPVGVTRWGHFGTPVVLFASAGGDGLEAERLQIIPALAPLLDSAPAASRCQMLPRFVGECL